MPLRFFGIALGAARDVMGLLPPHQQKSIEATLNEAALMAKTAEAKLAEELGYELCRCTWPPNIMIRTSASRMMGSPSVASPTRRGNARHAAIATRSRPQDRKSTRLNSSHTVISYAV